MKRAGAILLLLLFLTIHVGHLGYYWYGLKQIDRYWQQDAELTQDLKHLIVPIIIPYRNNDTAFRKGRGSILLEGVTYRIIYEKYDNKGLHILLAQDHSAQKLTREVSDWVNMTTDGEKSAAGHRADLVKHLMKDYLFRSSIELKERVLISLTCYKGVNVAATIDGFAHPDTPPPEGFFIPSRLI